MTDDLINRARLALEGYHRDHRAFGAEIARDSLGLCACDLLPEAVEEIKRLEAKVVRLEKVSIGVAASLAASISLLERGGKKAAASNKMFDQMLVDYRGYLEQFRAALAEIKGEGNE